MNSIDNRVISIMTEVVYLSLNLISTFGAAVLAVGIYALIPGTIIVIVGGTFGLIFLGCQMSVIRELKYVNSSQKRSLRTEFIHMTFYSNIKSPVMSQVGAALSGLRALYASHAS